MKILDESTNPVVPSQPTYRIFLEWRGISRSDFYTLKNILDARVVALKRIR